VKPRDFSRLVPIDRPALANTHRSGLSDEERIAYAGAITAAQGNMVGGF
jgi:hypothetical protein